MQNGDFVPDAITEQLCSAERPEVTPASDARLLPALTRCRKNIARQCVHPTCNERV